MIKEAIKRNVDPKNIIFATKLPFLKELGHRRSWLLLSQLLIILALILTAFTDPKDNLFFILGSDTAMNIRTWNNYEKLSALTNFLIALRKEDSLNDLKENFPFDYELIDGKKLDLSSTSIRHKLKDNIFNDEEIPLKIIQYIKKNSLY